MVGERPLLDSLDGRVLGSRYQIGQRIARGGMATVYEGQDLETGQVVAIKVMHPGLAENPEFANRFIREAHVASKLKHPNVVVPMDQGNDDGLLFLVMQYIPGGTLRDVIRSSAPMAASEALRLVEPVVSALAAAHEMNIVHRDVKPENILMGNDGQSVLTDFGLARAVNGPEDDTVSGGVLIGTVSYLAPELVVDGKSNAAADVYSVGVLLFEMLTGVKPHLADSPIQVAYKHVHEDVPAPSTRVPGTPSYLDALVQRAASRQIVARYANGRELLEAVQDVRRRLEADLSHGSLRSGTESESTPPGALLRSSSAVPEDTRIVSSILSSLDFSRKWAPLIPIRSLLLEVWDYEVAADWIRSPNLHLNGVRPLDALRAGKDQDVLMALEAVASGAFA